MIVIMLYYVSYILENENNIVSRRRRKIVQWQCMINDKPCDFNLISKYIIYNIKLVEF